MSIITYCLVFIPLAWLLTFVVIPISFVKEQLSIAYLSIVIVFVIYFICACIIPIPYRSILIVLMEIFGIVGISIIKGEKYENNRRKDN